MHLDRLLCNKLLPTSTPKLFCSHCSAMDFLIDIFPSVCAKIKKLKKYFRQNQYGSTFENVTSC
jgi:hypothetical protein